ncbi:glutaminase A [Halanaerobium praevalens]|uniref:Glutaminase n=1 Tax=Halanaerobium praevalens (strain ATCC 33744 / DSM 2228 / GSL) TaxID=572479 RepID=E3DQQ7_HALPG|nr:glutaminase A [Halanaerobium praevalens]ADO77968.1 L-glutaminase [Halanaerobium praevalens DSM 2228]
MLYNSLISKNKEQLQQKVEEVVENNRHYAKLGNLASYIPVLTEADPTQVGLSIWTIKGESFNAGAYQTRFTIQSISKIITLILALLDNGRDAVFKKVGMEPSGKSYNAIESINCCNKPFNPMINAGAIAVTSMIKGDSPQIKFARIMNFFKKITKSDNLELDERVYLSEKRTGIRNRTLAYYMKEKNIIEGEVEAALDLYFRQCSILVTAKELASLGAILANDGVDYETKEQIVPAAIVKLVRALMVTCGLYNESGEFAVKVGLPAKSGVGGGMLAIVPGKFGIGTFGPALDANGNSITGLKILENLAQALDLSIL